MNKNINKSIRTGLVAAASVLACFSCSDTWDDHYDAGLNGTVVDATLYQQISSQTELSDFVEILDATGYKVLLDESQIVTVFAPVNGTFNKDSLLLEIAKGPKEKDLVIQRFVKNHIARYNFSSNTESQKITLLNKKYTTLTNGVIGVDSVKAKSEVICKNGVLHVVETEIPFHSNIYELMQTDAEMDSIYNTLEKYDEDSLDVARSVYRGVDADGNRIYVDSVMINTNKLMARLGAYIQREDSNYTAIIPTDDAFAARYQETLDYFQYDQFENDGDSLQKYYANYYTLNTLFYNNNVNIHQNDSLVTTTYSKWDPEYNVFYEPFKADGILSDASYNEKIVCSNGLVYKTDSFPTSIYDAFFREIKFEAENNINNDVDPSSKTNEGKYTKNGMNKFVSIPNDSVSKRGAYMAIPKNSSAQPHIAYNIPNTLSGEYDMYIVTVPMKMAYGFSSDVMPEDTLKAYQFRVNMFYRKMTQNSTEWPGTKSETLKNPATGKNDYVSKVDQIDTIFIGTKKFDKCYYNAQMPGVMLQIQAYVSGSAKDLTRKMIIDQIILRPHGMPEKKKPVKKDDADLDEEQDQDEE